MPGSPMRFEVVHDDHFRATFVEQQIQFDIRYLRRHGGELHGNLRVACGLSGARTFGDDESISAGTLNFDSRAARAACAKYLGGRGLANTKIDLVGMLEAVSDAVTKASHHADPAVWLHEVTPTNGPRIYRVDGLSILAEHTNGFFAPGDSGKSLLAIYVGGRLGQQGINVGFADSELEEGDQLERLASIFPEPLPRIRYIRLRRSIVHEVDRLREETAQHAIQFWIYDSLSFGNDGNLIDADVAAAYFRAVKSITKGSLHIGHTKGGDGAEDRPYGSVFWFNGFRSLWYAKRVDDSDRDRLTLGLFQKKRNIGRRDPAIGFEFLFGQDGRVHVGNVDVRDVQELAESLPVWQRMKSALTRGPKTLATLADELGANVETLDRTVRRKNELFVRVPGSDGVTRIGLLEKGAAA